jgi:hypothetical protein
VRDIYVAVGLVVIAQIVGLYALFTRKADLVFSLIMVVILAAAAAIGVYGIYAKLH